MRRKRFLASTSFRLTLVLAAVLVAAFALAGLSAWYVTKAAAERASHQRIELEMDSLLDTSSREGLDAAVAEVRARQHMPGALEYKMLDPEGRLLVGDLQVDAPPGWSQAYLPDTEGSAGADLVILNRTSPDGASILIGEDLERTEGVRYAILRTLFWIGFAACLLSIVMGYFATRGTLMRMEDLFATMERAGAGDLDARVSERRGDQTDIDLLGQRINDSLARISDLVSNLRRVSTDIAHDLRTPITHVRQDIEAVHAADTLESAKAAALAAQTKIERLTRTFEATLRLAEIEAGTARSRFSKIDLSEVVDRIADAYRPDIESAGRTFSLETTKGAAIDGDADLLALATSNLLDNALKHAPAGKRISLRLMADEARIALIVGDDGPGIAAADRDRALDPFVRLDESRSTPGSGLGLSIVSAITKLHGGALTLEDARPGLRVAITWPR